MCAYFSIFLNVGVTHSVTLRVDCRLGLGTVLVLISS